MTEPNVDAGNPNVDEPKADAEGKHPDTVSWTQYVGLKEKFGKVETELKTKVGTLEEQLKGAINVEEHNKIKAELESTKTQQQKDADELKTSKEATLTEKRSTLTKRGVAEDKLANMSVEQLDGLLGALPEVKPKPDMGGGGGGGDAALKAKDKIRGGFDSLHPSK